MLRQQTAVEIFFLTSGFCQTGSGFFPQKHAGRYEKTTPNSSSKNSSFFPQKHAGKWKMTQKDTYMLDLSNFWFNMVRMDRWLSRWPSNVLNCVDKEKTCVDKMKTCLEKKIFCINTFILKNSKDNIFVYIIIILLLLLHIRLLVTLISNKLISNKIIVEEPYCIIFVGYHIYHYHYCHY